MGPAEHVQRSEGWDLIRGKNITGKGMETDKRRKRTGWNPR